MERQRGSFSTILRASAATVAISTATRVSDWTHKEDKSTEEQLRSFSAILQVYKDDIATSTVKRANTRTYGDARNIAI